MLTAHKYRDRASKRVILSIGSRLKGNAFDLPFPCEIGHCFEPSSFMFLRGTFAFRRRERSGDGPKFRIHLPQSGESDGLQIKGIAQNSCRARFDAHKSRATNRRRSSITEHSFHGIDTSSSKAESVTHVSGTFCPPMSRAAQSG